MPIHPSSLGNILSLQRTVSFVCWMLFGSLLFECLPVHRVLVAQGQLDEFSESVRGSPEIAYDSVAAPAPAPVTPEKRWHLVDYACQTDDSCEPALWGLIGMAGLYAVSSPYWIPLLAVGDGYSRSAHFPLYPYEGMHDGYMGFDHPTIGDQNNWSLRISGEYMDDFDDLQRMSGRVLWEFRNRLGIDISSDYRREVLPLGRLDHLTTGDANLVFRFAQSEYFQLRSGLGLNWFSDQRDDEFGFNFTYGGDWYPVKPWVITAEIDWGRLGHSHLFHARATCGVVVRGAECFAGYDYYDVAQSDLDGWIAGIRFWF